MCSSQSNFLLKSVFKPPLTFFLECHQFCEFAIIGGMHTCHLAHRICVFSHIPAPRCSIRIFSSERLEVTWLSAISSLLKRTRLELQALPMFPDNVTTCGSVASSSRHKCQERYHTRSPLTPWWHDASSKTTCGSVASSSRHKCQEH